MGLGIKNGRRISALSAGRPSLRLYLLFDVGQLVVDVRVGLVHEILDMQDILGHGVPEGLDRGDQRGDLLSLFRCGFDVVAVNAQDIVVALHLLA